MESSNAKDASGGGKPARTHWRRRDPAATAVYVVHPTQFRTVVQQLTGAPSPSATQQGNHQGGSSNDTAATTATAAGSNAAARPHQEQHAGGASRQRTLGQMHQECMAWANADDD